MAASQGHQAPHHAMAVQLLLTGVLCVYGAYTWTLLQLLLLLLMVLLMVLLQLDMHAQLALLLLLQVHQLAAPPALL
jgi:hypothetical protein